MIGFFMMRFFLLLRTLLILCLLVLLPMTLDVKGSAAADEMLDGFGDDFDGFKDSGQAAEDVSEPSVESKKDWTLPFDAGGCFTLMSSYNTAHEAPEPDKPDWRGLSALRAELKLEFEDKIKERFHWFLGINASHDFVYAVRDGNFNDDMIDDRETEIELGQAYVGGRINRHIDLRFGRQLVIWGKSDTIRVVDVINPQDIREPGMTDIEDQRLPLTMTKMDIYWQNWTLKTMAIHEVRFDKIPVWGSDYYPSSSILPEEHTPDSSFENTEFASSLSCTFNGGDFSLYYANLFNNDAHLETLSDDDPPQYSLHLDHDRINMAGFDFNLALGNLMLKTEMAVFDGVKYFNPAQSSGSTLIKGDCPEYTRYDGLIGFEYMGFNDTVISFDTALRYIAGFDEVLENSPMNPREKEEQWVLRLSREFMHEILDVELLVSMYGWNGSDGAFERLKASYDMTRHLTLTGGILFYHGGDGIPIETIGDNDRIYIQADYYF